MELGFSKIEGDHSAQEDAAAVNPNFATGKEYRKNCGNCAVAYELRRQGFDVAAAPSAGMPLDEWKKQFEGFEAHSRVGISASAVVENITKEALSWGEGARGMVAGAWKAGGAHVFSFEVSGGSVNFINSQDPRKDANLFFDRMNPQSIVYGRTDNLKFNDGGKSAVIDRKGKSHDIKRGV